MLKKKCQWYKSCHTKATDKLLRKLYQQNTDKRCSVATFWDKKKMPSILQKNTKQYSFWIITEHGVFEPKTEWFILLDQISILKDMHK